MSGGSKTKQSNQQVVDPNMYQAIYGQGAAQPVYNAKGKVKVAGKTGVGGLIPDSVKLYNQGPQSFYPNDTYASMNPLQQSAIGQQVNYLTSPEALQGYDASRQVAGTFLNQLQNTAPTGTAGAPLDLSQFQQAGAPYDFNAIREAYNTTAGQQFTPASAVAPEVAAPMLASGSGVNYRDYMNKLIGDDSAINPFVQDIADANARSTTQNYLEQVAPAFRSGDRMSGMYGNSRSGIVEARGISDLNRGIQDSNNSLFGSAYESNQNRRAGAAGQMAGLDAQTQMANAQLAASAQQAEAMRQMQTQMFNSQMGFDAYRTGLDYDLGSRGLGLQEAGLQSNHDLGLRGLGLQGAGQAANYDLGLRGMDLNNRQLTSQNAISGAALANQASQIPMQNLASLFGAGGVYQSDLQNQINADRERWDYNQMAPWQNIYNLQNVLQPNTQLGQTQVGKSKTSQSANPLGYVAMGLGAFGQGGAFGPGGAFGGLLGGGSKAGYAQQQFPLDLGFQWPGGYQYGS